MKNRFLPNGHCFQNNDILPIFLPANGGLLITVALMALAGMVHRTVMLLDFPMTAVGQFVGKESGRYREERKLRKRDKA